MQATPPPPSTCPTCGGALEKTHDGGICCPACLLRAGIGVEHSASDALEDSNMSARFGVYEIERREDGTLFELGRGGMGATYRAIDTTLQRKVALKIIQIGVASRSIEARERFLREARAAAALRHEHIATVFQFGISEDTGQFFYAMELIEGETLEERVGRAHDYRNRAPGLFGIGRSGEAQPYPSRSEASEFDAHFARRRRRRHRADGGSTCENHRLRFGQIAQCAGRNDPPNA